VKRRVTYDWRLKVWVEDNGDWWLVLRGRWRRLRQCRGPLRAVR
jgi:hypothetical protein